MSELKQNFLKSCAVKAGPSSHTISDGTPNHAIMLVIKVRAQVAAVASGTPTASIQRV